MIARLSLSKFISGPESISHLGPRVWQALLIPVIYGYISVSLAAFSVHLLKGYSAESSYETAVFCQDQGLMEELFRDLRITMASSTPLVLDPDAH